LPNVSRSIPRNHFSGDNNFVRRNFTPRGDPCYVDRQCFFPSFGCTRSSNQFTCCVNSSAIYGPPPFEYTSIVSCTHTKRVTMILKIKVALVGNLLCFYESPSLRVPRHGIKGSLTPRYLVLRVLVKRGAIACQKKKLKLLSYPPLP
jgi:hypothetical protein